MQAVLAQVNLVPNGSFEEYDTCPTASGQIYYASDWFSPTQGSPDYFNECTVLADFWGTPNNIRGSQQSFGKAYAYIGYNLNVQPTGYSEYISIKLISPLEINKKYCISFYLSLAEVSKVYTSSIGVLFSNTIPNYNFYTIIPTSPQIANSPSNYFNDKVNWMQFKTEYIATGDENYITIGFFENPTFQYQFISTTDTSNAILGYYIDGVYVGTCETIIPNVFTPNGDQLNETFKIENLLPNSRLTVYSRWGNIVYSNPNYANNWDGEMNSDGVYYYILSLPSGETKKGTVTILRGE